MEKNGSKFELIVIDGIKYPTKSMVISIHNFLVEYFAESEDEIYRGVLYQGNLEFNLEHIRRVDDNRFNFKNRIYLKAAHLLNYFITSHCFFDGNKRTAYVVFLLFLVLNKSKIPFYLTEYKKNYHILIELAKRKTKDERSINEIIYWIKESETLLSKFLK